MDGQAVETALPPVRNLPLGHAVQLDLPAVSWNVPSGQTGQAARPAVPANLPVGHSVQPLPSRWAPSEIPYRPARQREAQLAAPCVGSNLPIGHLLQSGLLPAENFPAGQRAQDGRPCTSWCWPVGQAEHASLSLPAPAAVPYRPGAQLAAHVAEPFVG